MTRTPIPDCPQPETPIRERAWADGQRPEPKYSDAEIGKKLRRLSAEMRNELCGDFADKLDAILASRQPTPDKVGVSDAMVTAYVSAVNEYLGNMTGAEWQADRLDKHAHLARVARIGLTAALPHFATQSAEAVRDGERYRWIRENGYSLIEEDRGNGPMFPFGDELDQAIDAAMREQSHD